MKEQNGEHPFGDSGQSILLVLFLGIWVVDSFFLRISTFLYNDISLLVRQVIWVNFSQLGVATTGGIAYKKNISLRFVIDC
jgi:hypothetical protein